jgi:hypothetical protein
MRSKYLLPETASGASWVLVGTAETATRLRPLIEAHRARRPVTVLRALEEVPAILNDAAAVVITGDVRKAPRIAVPGIFLHAANGRLVPCGWLPEAGARLTLYALSAAAVVSRESPKAREEPFVLLGEFDQRALETVSRIEAELPANLEVFRWTAERISNHDLVDALGSGPAMAMYFGHGGPFGWLGYGGVAPADAVKFRGSPLGLVLSLTCATASRPPRGLSFCEELTLSGVCAAALGAVGRVSHLRNVWLGIELARALCATPLTLASLLSAPNIPPAVLRHYRVLGDPLAQLIGAVDSTEKCRRVFAPGADESLPVIPLSAWASDEASEDNL